MIEYIVENIKPPLEEQLNDPLEEQLNNISWRMGNVKEKFTLKSA